MVNVNQLCDQDGRQGVVENWAACRGRRGGAEINKLLSGRVGANPLKMGDIKSVQRHEVKWDVRIQEQLVQPTNRTVLELLTDARQ